MKIASAFTLIVMFIFLTMIGFGAFASDNAHQAQTIQDLSAVNEQSAALNEDLGQENVDLKTTQARLETRVAELEKENAALAEANRQAGEQLTAAQQAQTRAESERDAANAALQQTSAERDQALQDLTAAQQNYTAALTLMRQMQQVNQDNQARAASLEKQVASCSQIYPPADAAGFTGSQALRLWPIPLLMALSAAGTAGLTKRGRRNARRGAQDGSADVWVRMSRAQARQYGRERQK